MNDLRRFPINSGPASAEPRCYAISSLHAAYGVDRVLLTVRINSPARSKFGLIHVSQFLAEILERVEEGLAVGGPIHALAQGINDRCGRALRGENANPEVVFEVKALFLERRNVWQRLGALGARHSERAYFS